MDFVLHSVNGSFPPPPDFDKVAESAVFAQVMSTFSWLPGTITPTFTPTFTPTPAPFTPLPPTVNPEQVISPLINKLFMIDASDGWAIGNSYVLHAFGGGATWFNVNPPDVFSVTNGFFQDINKGWILTPNGLYRTIDGGIHWSH